MLQIKVIALAFEEVYFSIGLRYFSFYLPTYLPICQDKQAAETLLMNHPTAIKGLFQ